MNSYLLILVMALLVVAFAAVTMVISALIGVKNPNPVKLQPFECGNPSEGSTLVQVPVKFYLVCLLFLLFDVETIFILGYALVAKDLGLYGLAVMSVFLGLLVVGLIYEWKRGALKWQ